MTEPEFGRHHGHDVPDHSVDDHARDEHGIFRYLGIAETFLGGLMVAGIFALLLLQVVQRYIPFEADLVWTGELARFFLVWFTFLVAGHLMARGEHVGINVIDYVLKGRALYAVKVFAALVVAVTCLAFAYAAFLLVRSSPGTSPVMGMPLTWLYVIPGLGLLLAAVQSLRAIATGRAGEVADSPGVEAE